MFIDNKASIDFTKNGKTSTCSKHISLREYFLRDLYKDGVIDVRYVEPSKQVVDIYQTVAKEKLLTLEDNDGSYAITRRGVGTENPIMPRPNSR
jgi:hypothetical protein